MGHTAICDGRRDCDAPWGCCAGLTGMSAGADNSMWEIVCHVVRGTLTAVLDPGIVAIDRWAETLMRPVGEESGIEKTEGVCGGSARISGTRIPVWQLVAARDLGVSEAQLLLDYPELRAEDLAKAWSYARARRDEIVAEIHENEVA
jgi:uncharacterized protein (DUF433 family)